MLSQLFKWVQVANLTISAIQYQNLSVTRKVSQWYSPAVIQILPNCKLSSSCFNLKAFAFAGVACLLLPLVEVVEDGVLHRLHVDPVPADGHRWEGNLGALNDDTKILTETDTETFFPILNFLKPKPRLFSENKFFRNRYRDFFPETKFSETETETFFRDKIFPKPKPRLFFRDQIVRNRNRNPQKFGKSLETET